MVDAADLKSASPKGEREFESRPGHTGFRAAPMARGRRRAVLRGPRVSLPQVTEVRAGDPRGAALMPTVRPTRRYGAGESRRSRRMTDHASSGHGHPAKACACHCPDPERDSGSRGRLTRSWAATARSAAALVCTSTCTRSSRHPPLESSGSLALAVMVEQVWPDIRLDSATHSRDRLNPGLGRRRVLVAERYARCSLMSTGLVVTLFSLVGTIVVGIAIWRFFAR